MIGMPSEEGGSAIAQFCSEYKTIPKAPYWGNDTELYLGHLGEMCPQKSMLGGVPAGKEDCLSLNVYTPFVSFPSNSFSMCQHPFLPLSESNKQEWLIMRQLMEIVCLCFAQETLKI
ncbi:hypothetical protein E2C01_077272 [Portunus trituberculatus]|uniref:Carboxylesterase type B domain-containing protein n=1 Tax=Portunus trituberculatus TaxID=210409 RepID=A0A5B7ILQ7_PORTR|nr:hypothetical protein [Portunus trituberculatus]